MPKKKTPAAEVAVPAPKPPSAAELLKAALAAKKAHGAVGRHVLRADKGEGNRAAKDAERLAGKSRKVH